MRPRDINRRRLRANVGHGAFPHGKPGEDTNNGQQHNCRGQTRNYMFQIHPVTSSVFLTA